MFCLYFMFKSMIFEEKPITNHDGYVIINQMQKTRGEAS